MIPNASKINLVGFVTVGIVPEGGSLPTGQKWVEQVPEEELEHVDRVVALLPHDLVGTEKARHGCAAGELAGGDEDLAHVVELGAREAMTLAGDSYRAVAAVAAATA